MVNQPHNPAGALAAPAAQRRLVELADRHGIYVMSDEVYRLLEHDAADRLPAMCDLYRRGLSVVTLSKPWGGCGISIGWMAFQDLDLRQRFVDVQAGNLNDILYGLKICFTFGLNNFPSSLNWTETCCMLPAYVSKLTSHLQTSRVPA